MTVTRDNNGPDPSIHQSDFANLYQFQLESFSCPAFLLKTKTYEIIGANKAARERGASLGGLCYTTRAKRESPCPWCLAPEVSKTKKETTVEFEDCDGLYRGCWIPVSEDYCIHYFSDASQQQWTDEVVRQNVFFLKKAQEIVKIGYFHFNPDLNQVQGSTEFVRIFDINHGQNLFKAFADSVHPEDGPIVFPAMTKALKSGNPYDIEHRVRHKNGTIIFVRAKGEVIQTLQGKQLIGVVQDITEKREAEQKLREVQKLLQDMIDHTQALVSVIDTKGCFLMVNQKFENTFGRKKCELLGKTRSVLMDKEMASKHLAQDKAVIKAKSPLTLEESFLERDGWHHYLSIKFPLRSETGDVYAICSLSTDITMIKHKESVLEARNRLLNFSFQHSLAEILEESINEIERLTESKIGFWHFVEPDQKKLVLQAWSTQTKKLFCRAAAGLTHYEIAKAGVWVDCVHQRKPVIHNDYESLPHKKGMPPDHAKLVRELVVPVMRNNLVVAVLGVGNKERDYVEEDVEMTVQFSDLIWDIAERKQAEEKLKESEYFFKESQRAAFIGSYKADFNKGQWQSSEILDKIFGIDRSYSKTIEGWLDLIYPEDRDMMERYLNEEVIGKHKPFNKEYRIIRKSDGEMRWLHGLGEVLIGQEGQVEFLIGTILDITDRKSLEENLFQSEKMSSIGLLAAGLAHNFNNYLGGILGYADLLFNSLQDEKQRKYAKLILESSQKASELTAQFLAFAQKGKYHSQPVDMHELISKTVLFLEQGLDQSIQIKQEFNASHAVLVGDPTLLQNMLLYLGFNAKEAIKEGGEILFATEELRLEKEEATSFHLSSGRYLKLIVKDNGLGMSAEIQKHIFDPFFTTKEQGKGPGLGLSAVHGVVNSHHGSISVKSEVHKGSTFTILLPLYIG